MSAPTITNADFDSGLAGGGSGGRGPGFSLTNETVADALRKLATAFDQGRANAIGATVVLHAKGDEFHEAVLHLRYQETGDA